MQSQFNSWQKQDLKSETEHLAASTWQASSSGRVTRRRWCPPPCSGKSIAAQLTHEQVTRSTSLTANTVQRACFSSLTLIRAEPACILYVSVEFSMSIDKGFSRTESHEYRLVWAAVHTSLYCYQSLQP